MSDRKNLKLQPELYRRLKDDKGAHMSWPEYFKTECLDDEIEQSDEDEGDNDEYATTPALAELLEAAHTIETRTGRIESTLDELQR